MTDPWTATIESALDAAGIGPGANMVAATAEFRAASMKRSRARTRWDEHPHALDGASEESKIGESEYPLTDAALESLAVAAARTVDNKTCWALVTARLRKLLRPVDVPPARDLVWARRAAILRAEKEAAKTAQRAALRGQKPPTGI